MAFTAALLAIDAPNLVAIDAITSQKIW